MLYDISCLLDSFVKDCLNILVRATAQPRSDICESLGIKPILITLFLFDSNLENQVRTVSHINQLADCLNLFTLVVNAQIKDSGQRFLNWPPNFIQFGQCCLVQ